MQQDGKKVRALGFSPNITVARGYDNAYKKTNIWSGVARIINAGRRKIEHPVPHAKISTRVISKGNTEWDLLKG